jgi:hypothetical protein
MNLRRQILLKAFRLFDVLVMMVCLAASMNIRLEQVPC